ncbi:MAG: hypothetical protein IKN34_12040 [Treponema sp.]|nr:hypothetical protein [Treponema sp.]
MKKIIGAALATSMLAGSAFAADLSFSYTGKNYFAEGSNLFGYDATARADCLSVGLSTENAGVVVDFDYDTGALVQDAYYGWMTFGLPVGNLQITAGKWSASYSDSVTTDAGDLDGEDWIKWNMGIENPNGSVGKKSDNLTYNPNTDSNPLSTVAAWTLADGLPGALLVKGGIVSVSEYDTWKSRSNHDAAWLSGFVGEVAYRQEKVINIDLAIKNLAKEQASFGIFVSPLMVENLEATLGLTLATEMPAQSQFTAKKDALGLYDRIFDFAIDLRARFAISDALSVTTAHNFTIYSVYDTAATTEDKTQEDTCLGMWNQIGFAYKMAEKLTAKFSYQQHMNQAFKYHDANYFADKVTNGCFIDNIYFTPSLEIAATEKATVTVASRFNWSNVGHEGNEKLAITVPVIFSYNF